ncbi:MAG: SDR family oxidoreductase, partial [Halalkalicoccus sp.]
VDTPVSEFGGLDHLVTSAGGPPSGPFLGTEEEDWYHAYDLLVMSVVRLVKEAAPHLQEGGGTIVTITSRSVKEAIDSLVLSNSVRMSVIGLEKTLSQELAPEVRANAVLPGPHETARIRELVDQAVERGDYDSYEEGLADWSDGIPLERIGDPIELGDTVAFLSSPLSGFVNGVAVPIDGGAGASNL